MIELLVVIAIIGTLSTIGFLALSGASDGADDAKKLAELQSVRSAATVELSKNRAYPIVSTANTHCARLDVDTGSGKNENLAGLVGQLSGFTLKNYVYCSNKDGTKFLVAVDLKGKLPTGGFTTATVRGTPTGSAVIASGEISKVATKGGGSGTLGVGSTPTVSITCQAGGASAGTYCVGNL